MIKKFISIFSWTAAVFVSVVMYFIMLPVTIILLPFDKDRRASHVIATWWAEGIMAFIPWKVRVGGAR